MVDEKTSDGTLAEAAQFLLQDYLDPYPPASEMQDSREFRLKEESKGIWPAAYATNVFKMSKTERLRIAAALCEAEARRLEDEEGKTPT